MTRRLQATKMRSSGKVINGKMSKLDYIIKCQEEFDRNNRDDHKEVFRKIDQLTAQTSKDINKLSNEIIEVKTVQHECKKNYEQKLKRAIALASGIFTCIGAIVASIISYIMRQQ